MICTDEYGMLSLNSYPKDYVFLCVTLRNLSAESPPLLGSECFIRWFTADTSALTVRLNLVV